MGNKFGMILKREEKKLQKNTKNNVNNSTEKKIMNRIGFFFIIHLILIANHQLKSQTARNSPNKKNCNSDKWHTRCFPFNAINNRDLFS